MGKRMLITPEMINEIVSRYDQGQSADEISRFIGCSVSTVVKYIKQERGVYINPTASRRTPHFKGGAALSQSQLRTKVIGLHKAGASIEDIATYLNIVPLTVKAYLDTTDSVNPDIPSLVMEAPINVYKIANFRENMKIGDVFRVKKEIFGVPSTASRYRYPKARVLRKYPFIVETNEGFFSYVDLFISSHNLD